MALLNKEAAFKAILFSICLSLQNSQSREVEATLVLYHLVLP